MAVWCSQPGAEHAQTVEMIVDFRKNTPALPPLLMNRIVAAVESFRFQRLYFLLQLKKINLPQELFLQFYSGVIESVL